MSNKTKKETTIEVYYRIIPKNGGFVPMKVEVEMPSQKVVSISELGPEDILLLTQNFISSRMRKDLGL